MTERLLSTHADIARLPQASAMRAIYLLSAVALLVGCHSDARGPGWHYRPETDGFIGYGFDDGEAGFGGFCEPEPVFLIAGGDWEGNPFTLTVDGKSWRLPAQQLEHGHILLVELPLAVQAIGDASNRVIFQVGAWRREIVPVPQLRDFLANCRP